MELKQAREAFESFQESKVGRIAKRGKDFVWKFTPWGRYDEYMEKFSDTLTKKVNGKERYDLRKELDRDARRYARNKVLRDFAIGTAAVGGAILLKRELNPANRASDLAKLGQLGDRVVRFGQGVAETPAKAAQAIKDAPLHVAAASQVAVEGATRAATTQLKTLAREAPLRAQIGALGIVQRILGEPKPKA